MLIHVIHPIEPTFHHPSNIEAIKEDFYSKGIAFIEGCDEKALAELARKFGSIVKPRNESTSCSGISNIRFAPSLVGKGYSSEGETKTSQPVKKSTA